MVRQPSVLRNVEPSARLDFTPSEAYTVRLHVDPEPFSRVLLASILVLVALLAVAPAFHLAADIGHTDPGGKRSAHGWLGKSPWASEPRVVPPSLDLLGPTLAAEPLRHLPVIPDFAFVPPRR
jgi:hypothetical protein